ncbi:Hypothetical predicted protein, partial [Paramuricea clavata]
MATDGTQTEGINIPQLQRSIRGYRSHFSRTFSSCIHFANMEGSHAMVDELKERYNEMKKYYGKLIDATIEVQEADPDNLPKYDEELDKDRVRFEEASSATAKVLSSNLRRNDTQSTTEHNRNEIRVSKINEALKPGILSKDATPLEMRQWEESFNAYFASNKMDAMPLPEQQSYFKV